MTNDLTPEIRVEHLKALDDAEDQVRAARQALNDAIERRASVLRSAKAATLTWPELGQRLGVSAQQIQQASKSRNDRVDARRDRRNARE